MYWFCRAFTCMILVFSCCFLPGSAHAADSSEGTALQQGGSSGGLSKEAPSLLISEARFDFGEVLEGTVLAHDFTVKNTGKGVLEIYKVTPD